MEFEHSEIVGEYIKIRGIYINAFNEWQGPAAEDLLTWHWGPYEADISPRYSEGVGSFLVYGYRGELLVDLIAREDTTSHIVGAGRFEGRLIIARNDSFYVVKSDELVPIAGTENIFDEAKGGDYAGELNEGWPVLFSQSGEKAVTTFRGAYSATLWADVPTRTIITFSLVSGTILADVVVDEISPTETYENITRSIDEDGWAENHEFIACLLGFAPEYTGVGRATPLEHNTNNLLVNSLAQWLIASDFQGSDEVLVEAFINHSTTESITSDGDILAYSENLSCAALLVEDVPCKYDYNWSQYDSWTYRTWVTVVGGSFEFSVDTSSDEYSYRETARAKHEWDGAWNDYLFPPAVDAAGSVVLSRTQMELRGIFCDLRFGVFGGVIATATTNNQYNFTVPTCNFKKGKPGTKFTYSTEIVFYTGGTIEYSKDVQELAEAWADTVDGEGESQQHCSDPRTWHEIDTHTSSSTPYKFADRRAYFSGGKSRNVKTSMDQHTWFSSVADFSALDIFQSLDDVIFSYLYNHTSAQATDAIPFVGAPSEHPSITNINLIRSK